MSNTETNTETLPGLDKTEEIGASDLTKPLAEGMPEPSDSSLPPPSSSVGTKDEPASNGPLLFDAAGRKFDPTRHKVDESGNPKTDKIGRFIFIGQGRPKNRRGAVASVPKAAPAGFDGKPPAEGTQPENQQTRAPDSKPFDVQDQFDLAAEMYCRAGYNMASMIFGDDGWQPENAAEHNGMKAAVAAYLRFKGVEDLPPGWALALSLGTYATKRMNREKTKGKIRGIILLLREKFSRKPKAPEAEKL